MNSKESSQNLWIPKINILEKNFFGWDNTKMNEGEVHDRNDSLNQNFQKFIVQNYAKKDSRISKLFLKRKLRLLKVPILSDFGEFLANLSNRSVRSDNFPEKERKKKFHCFGWEKFVTKKIFFSLRLKKPSPYSVVSDSWRETSDFLERISAKVWNFRERLGSPDAKRKFLESLNFFEMFFF